MKRYSSHVPTWRDAVRALFPRPSLGFLSVLFVVGLFVATAEPSAVATARSWWDLVLAVRPNMVGFVLMLAAAIAAGRIPEATR